MKKPTLTYLLALILNIIAYGLTTYLFNWKLTLCIFLLIWANNAEKNYREK